MLLPEFPTTELEDALRECGFTSFVQPVNGEPTEVDGLHGDDPGADLAHGRPDRRLVAVALRRPVPGAEPERRAPVGAGGVPRARPGRRATSCSSPAPSGSRWSTSCRPGRSSRWAGRSASGSSTARCATSRSSARAYVFPTAGPPCFLDEELWGFNDIFGDESNIFPDQTVYLAWLAERGHDEGRLLLPGSVASIAEAGCPVVHPYEPETIYASNETKTAYLREMQARRMPEVDALRAGWAHPEIDVLADVARVVHAAAGGGRAHRGRHRRRRPVHLRGRRTRRRRRADRLRGARGAGLRGGEGALPLPHPARLRRAADRRARDRLGRTRCSCPAGSPRSASARTTSSSTSSSSACPRSG